MTRLILALLILPVVAHAADCKPPNVARVIARPPNTSRAYVHSTLLKCPIEGSCFTDDVLIFPIVEMICLTQVENAAAEARIQ
jgi:hypothetical protein